MTNNDNINMLMMKCQTTQDRIVIFRTNMSPNSSPTPLRNNEENGDLTVKKILREKGHESS
jgi:hypothetical protein